jgi:hypothetical protein
MNCNNSDFLTPKTFSKSEAGLGFPRIFSSNSQVKPIRNLLSGTQKTRKLFVVKEKQKEIIKNNQILLAKMLEIEKNPSFFLVACADQSRKCSEKVKNRAKLRKTDFSLKEKLKSVKSCYSFKKFEKDYEKNSKKLNYSYASNPQLKSHKIMMKKLDKMMQRELKRQADLRHMQLV